MRPIPGLAFTVSIALFSLAACATQKPAVSTLPAPDIEAGQVAPLAEPQAPATVQPPVPSPASDLALGQASYAQFCAGCHGGDGLKNSAKLPAISRESDVSEIVFMIENSEPMSLYVSPSMTAEQRLAVATYVKSTLAKTAP